MQHTKQETFEKSIIAMEKRLQELRQLKYNRPKVKIDEPYQDGWIVYISLRDDAMRRDDVYKMLEVIELSGTTHYTRNAKLVSEIRKRKGLHECRKLFWYKQNIYTLYTEGPHFRPMDEKQFSKLDEALKSSYYSYTEYIRWGNTTITKYVPNIPDYYLVLKVRPYMVTERYEIDPAVLAEISYLEERIRQVNGYAKLYGQYYRKRFSKSAMRASFRNLKSKYLKGEAEDIIETKAHREEW